MDDEKLALQYRDCCKQVPPQCEHWRAFDREMLRAHLRGNLTEEANRLVLELQAYETPVNARNLYDALIMRLSSKRTQLVPFGVTDAVVDQTAKEVAAAVATDQEDFVKDVAKLGGK